MVCPNCHSDQVIAVQDQHFCINCGQMVPEQSVPAAKKLSKLQSNGLPEGVKILSLDPSSEPPLFDAVALPEAAVVTPTVTAPNQEDSIIHGRTRLGTISELPPVVKRRKPGRPKSGRLDVPRIIASNAPTATLPSAPQITSTTFTAGASTTAPRSMSDLAPRRASTQPPTHRTTKLVTATEPAVAAKSHHAPAPTRQKRIKAQRIGVPALHYGPIIAFSFRARTHPRFIGLAALGAASLGVAAVYGVWEMLSVGPVAVAARVLQAGPKLAGEAVLLALLYYIGRSIGQTAITYGIAREADQRPATLSRQFGVAINTFARRLKLDLMYGSMELTLIAAAIALFFSGGATWPVNANIQVGLLFGSYMVILYLLSALALSRGLAGVNLTLTTHTARTAAKVGWKLFSHRFELIGPRFGAALMEAVLAVPLVAIGVAFIVIAPSAYHVAVAIAAGLLAWLAGALLGVGTAAWWSMLYRQLVLTDRPNAAVALLSSRQPEEARRTPLVFIVALITLLIGVALALPWVQLT